MIFIGGDSWGCGEWTCVDDVYSISHPGLQQHFIDSGYTVVNSSEGNSSNLFSIDRLKNSLTEHYKHGDIILFIQTDSIRDLRPYDLNLSKEIQKFNGIVPLKHNLLQNTYKKLNELGIEFNTKIYVIGGKEDLYLEAFNNFENIIPLVPSWVYLLVGHFEEYKNLFPQWTSSDYRLSDVADLFDDTWLYELRHKVVDEMYHSEKCWKMYRESIFWPDGFHPNKQGHEILFNYIIGKLKL